MASRENPFARFLEIQHVTLSLIIIIVNHDYIYLILWLSFSEKVREILWKYKRKICPLCQYLSILAVMASLSEGGGGYS